MALLPLLLPLLLLDASGVAEDDSSSSSPMLSLARTGRRGPVSPSFWSSSPLSASESSLRSKPSSSPVAING